MTESALSKIYMFSFSLFFCTFLILFFLLGRISIEWNSSDTCKSIQGINIAAPEEVASFINVLDNYEYKDFYINEIDIFEDVQQEKSQENAQFVASTQGKYYYLLESEKGSRLSEKNRIYFDSEKQAQQYGYIKGD